MIGLAQPFVETAEGALGALMPNALPVLHQVDEVRTVVTDLLASLEQHFGGKMGLPAPPTGTNQTHGP